MKVSGTVKAFTYMNLPKLGGEDCHRKVSLGARHCVSLETAQDMVNELRARVHADAYRKPGYTDAIIEVYAQFTAEL